MTAHLPQSAPKSSASLPGDALLHPLVIGSVMVLLANDHLLKGAFPGWWTGKLSDAAGLIVLAVVLLSTIELLGAAPTRRTLVASLLVSGVTLVAIKLTPLGGEAFRWGLGGVQWIGGVLAAASLGRVGPPHAPVALVQDASDLIVLPALLIGWLALRRRCHT